MLDNIPLTSILVLLITIIVVGVGGAIAIIHPDLLSFSDYVKDVGIGVGSSSAGLGILGVARSQAGKG